MVKITNVNNDKGESTDSTDSRRMEGCSDVDGMSINLAL